jgi:hypothetical protein
MNRQQASALRPGFGLSLGGSEGTRIVRSDHHFQINFSEVPTSEIENIKKEILKDNNKIVHFVALADQFNATRLSSCCDIVKFATLIRNSAQIKGKASFTADFIKLFLWDKHYTDFYNYVKAMVVPTTKIKKKTQQVSIRTFIETRQFKHFVENRAAKMAKKPKSLGTPLIWYEDLRKRKFQEVKDQIKLKVGEDFGPNYSERPKPMKALTNEEYIGRRNSALYQEEEKSTSMAECIVKYKDIDHMRQADHEIQKDFVTECANLVYGAGNWEMMETRPREKTEADWLAKRNYCEEKEFPIVPESQIIIELFTYLGSNYFKIGNNTVGFATYEKKKHGITMVRILSVEQTHDNSLSVDLSSDL